MSEEEKQIYLRGHKDGQLYALLRGKNKIGAIVHTHRSDSLRDEIRGLEWAIALISELEVELRR